MTFEKFLGLVKRNCYATRKNKRYGTDQMDFEADYISRLIKFAYELWLRVFRILLNYAFLTSVPKWREIFATIFEGRMADHMLCDPLIPYMEKDLSERTYNNRKDKGAMAAINQLIEDIYEVTEGYTKPARIIKFDLEGFFPHALWDEMYKCYDDLITKYHNEIVEEYGDGFPEFLKWLAMICIYCRPTEHCIIRTPTHYWYQKISRRKSMFPVEDGRGAPIGRLTSQHGMGMYINDIIKWLISLGIRVICFVDDIVLVVPERLHEYVLSYIPVLRKKFAAIGIKINERKFYDQPWQHGVEFLGSHIMPNRTHLNVKTVSRGLARIDDFNNAAQYNKEKLLDSYIASVNSYTGLLKNRTDYKKVQLFRKKVSKGWSCMVVWNERKQCLAYATGYRTKDRLTRKYGSRRRNNKLNAEIQKFTETSKAA